MFGTLLIYTNSQHILIDADIRYSLENNEDMGLEDDIENACFELINVRIAYNFCLSLYSLGKYGKSDCANERVILFL